MVLILSDGVAAAADPRSKGALERAVKSTIAAARRAAAAHVAIWSYKLDLAAAAGGRNGEAQQEQR